MNWFFSEANKKLHDTNDDLRAALEVSINDINNEWKYVKWLIVWTAINIWKWYWSWQLNEQPKLRYGHFGFNPGNVANIWQI